jgi:thioesterase domain-containing protein
MRCEKDPSARILRTGDVVRLRPDSLVEMLGRKDRQIKMRGYRVNLDEVEAILRDLLKVAEVAVIARRAREEVSALVAFVVPSASVTDEIVQDLKTEIEAHLPPHMQPLHIRILQEIPKLSGFKPDFQKLASIDQQKLDEKSDRRSEMADLAEEAVDPESIRHIVETAWTTVLNRRSFDADTPWDDAGGDSLVTLSLWFVIEQALGPVPLDIFRQQMKPSELAQALIAHLQSGAEAPEAASQAAAPLVFFMPPYEGDIPLLVRFRAALRDRVRFSAIHYPGWKETMKSDVRFDAIVEAALGQILARIDGRRCALVGYSFGGIVAWETARRLKERGYEVAFLGLIDTALDGLPHPDMGGRVSRFFQRLRSAPRVEFTDSVVKNLLRGSNVATLKVMNRAIELAAPSLSLGFQRHMTGQLRLRALDRWTVAPLDICATLFRSDDGWKYAPDFGWRRVCEDLTIVRIGGSHESILQPPFLQLLCDRFVESVRASVFPAPAAMVRAGEGGAVRSNA